MAVQKVTIPRLTVHNITDSPFWIGSSKVFPGQSLDVRLTEGFSFSVYENIEGYSWESVVEDDGSLIVDNGQPIVDLVAG